MEATMPPGSLLHKLLLAAWVLFLVLALSGCVVVDYQDETRRVLIMRGLTDTGIEGFDASTPDGTTVKLKGYTSEQAKAIELVRAVMEAAK
jgi:hypothetical protein